MKDFILRDDLRHLSFSWPKTMLTYPIVGDKPTIGQDVLTVNGVPTAYQVEGDTLKVMSDLPTYATYSFAFQKGSAHITTSLYGLSNGTISIESIEGGLISVIDHKGATFTYAVDTRIPLIRIEESVTTGDIESTITKTLIYEGERTYTFKASIKADLDYVEIYENMTGFQKGEANLNITYTGYEPRYRYTIDRGEEKIDSYLHADGTMPFVIDPFMARVSIWDQKCMAYIDKSQGLWSGIMVHDSEAWDDGEYAVWGSSYTLAMRLYVDKIVAPIVEGKRAFMHILSRKPIGDIKTLYTRYYCNISLNKVKDWVLSWQDSQMEYPKFFSHAKGVADEYWYFERNSEPTPQDMMDCIDKFTTALITPEDVSPVSCRTYLYTWAPVFDMSAHNMTDDQFARARATMAFLCYTYMSEDYYPTRNLFAGHPNFITDVIGTIGIFAALLGKSHPMYRAWLDYYERGLALNLKYHVRPDVPHWDALGGRWTENVGCYMFGMLHCCIWVCSVIYHVTGGEMPMAYPNMTKLLAFLVNNENTENKVGRRLYSPHGSHSCTGEFGADYGHGFTDTMLMLADMCKYYEPLYAEYILHNYRKDSDYYGVLRDLGVSGRSYANYISPNMGGTEPDLYSCKYTGMGYMLRSHANTDDEMNVFLQQIDEGPNYRWGRAAGGGCGEIYYHANHNKYTGHSPEDVGDENRGDVQSCTNFGVLIDHEFRSVGRNELTEPLMDFGFAQYARVNAGPRSTPYYKYRALMMIDNSYIAVYDAVADKRQRGRFSWAEYKDSIYPSIFNLKPGVEGKSNDSGKPIDSDPNYTRSYEPCTLKTWEGQGDFFTVVTHLRHWGNEPLVYSPKAQEYGCYINTPTHQDRVYFDQSRSYVNDIDCGFDGYVGYSTYNNNDLYVAIFDGAYIRLKGLTLSIPYDKDIRHGMSATLVGGHISGKAVFLSEGEVKVSASAGLKVYIDSVEVKAQYLDGEYIFTMPSGKHCYNIGLLPDIAKCTISATTTYSTKADIYWQGVAGASEYEISISADREETYSTVAKVKANNGTNTYTLSSLAEGKYHVRVRGVRDDMVGEYSHDYPLYITSAVPHQPEAMHVEKLGDTYKATWGGVLGVKEYRLYRVGSTTPIYVGLDREYVGLEAGEYYVTAVNGNGESVASITRSTASPLATWDNHPERGFVRDTRSHEHGYPGFDFINNTTKPILNYPED